MHVLSILTKWSRPVPAFACLILFAASAAAQITTFTYQGRLTDGGNPANGSYEMRFTVFDTPSVGTGTQQASPITTTTSVSSGVFTVSLDFGSSVFNGADRYLEIAVRPAGSAVAFSTLAQRHAATSSPYAITSLTAINAQNLGGISASRFVAASANGNVGIGTGNPVFGKLQVESATGTAVHAVSPDWVGAFGYSSTFEGVRGESRSAGAAGVGGYSDSANNIGDGTGIGVWGQSGSGTGVHGTTASGTGVKGISGTGTGVYGESAAAGALTIAGVRGVSTGSNGLGVIGSATSNNSAAVGVYGENASATGYGVYARNFEGHAIWADGHVAQTFGTGGLVKAAVFVDENTAISRCYNSLLNGAAATTAPCGFSISRSCNGDFCHDLVTFPFSLTGLFWTTSVAPPVGAVTTLNRGANVRRTGNSLEVTLFATDEGVTSNTVHPFTIVLF